MAFADLVAVSFFAGGGFLARGFRGVRARRDAGFSSAYAVNWVYPVGRESTYQLGDSSGTG